MIASREIGMRLQKYTGIWSKKKQQSCDAGMNRYHMTVVVISGPLNRYGKQVGQFGIYNAIGSEYQSLI